MGSPSLVVFLVRAFVVAAHAVLAALVVHAVRVVKIQGLEFLLLLDLDLDLDLDLELLLELLFLRMV